MKKITILTLCLLMATTAFSQSGNVLTLDGTGDYVSVPSSDDFDIGRHFTIETWVRLNGAQQKWAGLVTKGGTDLRVQMANRGKRLEFTTAGRNPGNSGIDESRLYSKNALTQDSWIHLATVCSDTVLSLYINGEKTDSISVQHLNDLDSGRGLYFGSIFEYRTRVFTGEMDEIRIWNDARTQQEIQDNMNSVLVGNEEDLVGYWNFDDGTYDDLTSNENNGTPAGDASIISLVAAEDDILPTNSGLSSNYPNPFVGSTTITYALTQPAFVNVTVCDMLGREVKVLANGFTSAGQNTIEFDGKGLPSGVYIYKLVIGDEVVETKAMVLAK